MVIVLFSKGCEKIVHICHYNGIDPHECANRLMEKHKDAMYYEVFSEKEYEAKFE